jgi:hypothetical protein
MRKWVIPMMGLVVLAGMVVLVAIHRPSGSPGKHSSGYPDTGEADVAPHGATGSTPPVPYVTFATDARLDDGTPFVSWDVTSTIPFLFLSSKGEASGQLAFRLGLWNTDTGTITLRDDSLFSVSEECRIFWDGSERFIVCRTRAGDAGRLRVTVNDRRLSVRVPELALSLPSNRHSLVAVLPGDSGVASAYRGLLGGATLEIQGGPLEGKVDLVPPNLPPNAEVLGPVAMDADSASRLVVYVETFRAASKDGQGYTLCSILAATWDGRGVSWRVVAKDMDVNEAGAGSQMGRYGDRLAVCDYRGVRLLDLVTGELEPLAELDAAMKTFIKENVKETEYAASPVPGSYRDFLLVQWDIPSVEGGRDTPITFIPTSYLAAVRGGEVVGEVKRVDNRMWIEKDGKVTAEIGVPPEAWILPR